MTKFEEDFDNNVEIFDVIGNHNSMCCEVDQVKEVFKDWQPQQSLPVVPECVAEWIEFCKNGKNIFSFLNQDSFYHSGKAKELCEKVRRWSQMSEEKLTLMACAWLDGYTVEKPKLFYLKNMLTGDCLAICLARASSGLYVEVTEKWLTRKEQTSYKLYFTQQEIDNMETGSYEQIEVEK